MSSGGPPALNSSHPLAGQLLDALPQLVWAADGEGRWLQANSALRSFLGSGAALPESDFVSALHPADRPRALQAWREARESGQPGRLEVRLRRHDGAFRHFDCEYRPVQQTPGALPAWLGACSEVHALRERLREAGDIIEASGDCIKFLDLEGRLLYLNAGGLQALELPSFAVCEGAHWKEFWNDSMRPTVEAALEQARSGKTGQFEGFCPTFAGTPKWWSVTVSPVYDDVGQLHRFLAVSRDITDRVRSELRSQRWQSVTATLTGALGREEVVEVVLNEGLSVTQADAGGVMLLSDDGAALEVLSQRGYPPEMLERFSRIPLSAHTPVSDAARDGQARFLSEEAFAAQYPELAGQRSSFRATAQLPLIVNGRVIGALLLSFTHDRAFEASDRQFLGALAAQCAQALERARLYDAELAVRAELAGTASLLDTLFASAPLGVGFLDHQLRYQRVNEALAALHGVERGELLGRRLEEVPHREGWTLSERIGTLQRQALEGRQPVVGVELESAPGPHARHFLVSYYPLQDAAGELLGLGVMIVETTERVRAAQALVESEQRYRTLMDSVPQIVWTVSPGGRIEQFNQRWQEFTGRPLVPNGNDWVELMHPEDRQRGLAVRSERIPAQQAYAYETRLRHRSGEYRWLLVQAEPVRNPQTGEFLGWVGGAADITDRKRAEQAVRQLNQTLEERVAARTRELEQERGFLQALLESLSEGIVACDAQGRLTVFNHATRQIHGLPAQPLAPEAWSGHYRLLRPDGHTPLPTAEIPLYRAFSGESVRDAEMVVRPVEGNERYVLASGNPILAPTGEKLGAVVAMRDVTEQRAARERLEAARRELERLNTFNRLLLDSAGEGVFGVDMAGVTTFANPAALKMIGFTREEVVGESQHLLVHHTRADGSPYPVHDCPIYNSRLDGEVRRVDDEVFWRKDGSSFPVEYVSTPLRSVSGEIEGAVVIFKDITERKRAEEELRQANGELRRSNAELEQFAYVASHDLQEPLRTVSSFTELLARRYEGQLDEHADKYIEFITRGAQRMKRLIEDLLTFSRLGTAPQAPVRLPLQAVLSDTLDGLRAAIAERGAHVTWDALPEVTGDAGQVAQLLQNLIGNALKFSRPDVPPEVHVGARREGAAWHFTVRDNGIGIDPSYFDRIFGIFQRLHSRDVYEGTGIGLAVCRKIVEQHGGRLWVESRPGEGSTFHFTWPDSE